MLKIGARFLLCFSIKKSVFLQLLTHAQSPELNQNYIKTITKVLYDLVSSVSSISDSTPNSEDRYSEFPFFAREELINIVKELSLR